MLQRNVTKRLQAPDYNGRGSLSPDASYSDAPCPDASSFQAASCPDACHPPCLSSFEGDCDQCLPSFESGPFPLWHVAAADVVVGAMFTQLGHAAQHGAYQNVISISS